MLECPNCHYPMSEMGCCLVVGLPVRWCPSCGTIKPCDHEPIVPAMARKKQPHVISTQGK